jgi:hypothetical protein
MAIPLFIIAAVLFAAAYQNQLGYLAGLAEQDVKGALPWMGAMAVIGAIGMFKGTRAISNALFFLVILVLFVANKGIFANLKTAFTPISPPAAPVAQGSQAQTPATAPGTQATGSITPTGTTNPATAPAIPLTAQAGNVIPFPANPLSIPGLPANATGISMAPDGSIKFQ